ncbi:hypothetical protein ASD50_17185 [Mesorhizobium sp. Root552]|uniref:MAPEG family protein n=1 Tax=Mesorhizobium sp. Root552 TaxID=1736555 RepID=UPI0006FF5CF1|nr:MAPEG family protein [Mesorhizobium sp. Root552]KQZ30749.1 hypothetical protein ASD50_17185 [Mesorhizobium sp. Root552]
MNPIAIFWPMVAHFFLVSAIYVLLGWRRRIAVTSGGAKVRQFKVRTQEPEGSVTAANNLMNQFELPVLFHIVCLAFFVTNGVSFVAVLLAWVFVALRYLHAYVHVTSNNLRIRSLSFAAGFVIVVLMWAWFSLHLAGLV